jgi:hypothetical protein
MKGHNMIHAHKSRSVLVIAAVISLAAGQAAAATYKATLIGPMGYTDTTATGISGSSVVGLGNPTPETLGAFLLDRATSSIIDLNPIGWDAQPNAVSGEFQVGHGAGPTTGFATHALLWHGTAASMVDLNPTGFSNSWAYGVSGNNQVGAGWGDATTIPPRGPVSHALLWHGTADSVVDLHPAGYTGSQANAVFEDKVVGFGFGSPGGLWHALLWHGAADSVVDLHPAQYPQTFASDLSQDSQVGTGVFSSLPGGERHALLWHGTAASVIDLHSFGFTQTGANAVAGNLQVGFGLGAATGGQQHALLWESTAASVVDLHSALTGLGPSFVSSYAVDIDECGVIVGTAGDGNNSYAVMWSPVPEPAGVTLLMVGLVTAYYAHRRYKSARVRDSASNQTRCTLSSYHGPRV